MSYPTQEFEKLRSLLNELDNLAKSGVRTNTFEIASIDEEIKGLVGVINDYYKELELTKN